MILKLKKGFRMYRAKSARSGYSDDSRDHETDSAQLELASLQQRYRIIEAERQRIRQSHELTKDEQKKKLRQLAIEANNLDKNLKLATSRVSHDLIDYHFHYHQKYF